MVSVCRIQPAERLVFWCKDGIKDDGLAALVFTKDCPTKKGDYWMNDYSVPP